MGFESFRVELRGDANTFASKGTFLHHFPSAKPDPEALPYPGSAFFVVDDGLHILEIEVSESPARLSVRFTLCHPESIVEAFLRLLRDLMAVFQMSAKIRDDVRPEHSDWYSAARYDEFASIVPQYIARRRSEWVASFGPAQLSAKTSEVFRRIVLPNCEPVLQSTDASKLDCIAKAYRPETIGST